MAVLKNMFDTRYERYLHYSRRSWRHVPIAFDLPHRLQTEFCYRIERALLHFSLPRWIGSNALFIHPRDSLILSFSLSPSLSRYLFILSSPLYLPFCLIRKHWTGYLILYVLQHELFMKIFILQGFILSRMKEIFKSVGLEWQNDSVINNCFYVLLSTICDECY